LFAFVALQIRAAQASDSLYPGTHMVFGEGSAAQTAELAVVVVVQEATVVLHRRKGSWDSWRSSLLLLRVLPVPAVDVRLPLPRLHPGPPLVESKPTPMSA